MKRAITAVALSTLCACASTANGPSRLTGQELDAAVALYGDWVDQVELEGGRPLYIWRRSLVRGGSPRYCELRVELGFRRTIRKAYMQGFPDACKLFAVRYEPVGN